MKERKCSYPEKSSGFDFTLKIGCRLNCKYCPQQLLLKRYGQVFGADAKRELSFEDFCIMLDRIAEGSVISIAGMSEPFLNRDCAKMIKYAYEKGYGIILPTTFQGATKEDIDLISGVCFKELWLHIPDQEGNSQFIIDDHYKSVLKYALSKFEVSAFSCHGMPRKDMEWCIDRRKTLGNEMMNRAGNLDCPELRTYQHKGRITCAAGSFTGIAGPSPVVLPNGAVIRCCQDYGLRHIYGNLLTQTWQEIVAGEEYKKFESGMTDESIDSLCRSCSMASKSVKEVHNQLKYRQYNAIAAGRILEGIKENPQKEYPHKELWEKILQADKIGIWGAGKLFSDNYSISWESVIQADFLVDNDPEKWGRTIGKLICISPEELPDIASGLLIITYCMEDREIREQLSKMGIENVINIIEIMDATQDD